VAAKSHTLWTLTKDGHTVSAELAFLDDLGIELRLRWNGKVGNSHMYRFPAAIGHRSAARA